MNQEQVISIVRQALLFGGGVLVSRGYLTAEELLGIVGALMALGASAWAIWSRRRVALVAAAAALPEVKSIVAERQIADAAGDKVRPPYAL